MSILIRLLVSGLTIGILDFLWLGFISKNFYANEIGKLLLEKPNMIAALAFYVIYIIGIVVFVINPALASGSFWSAVGFGALFGVVAYATYDLTNLATMNGFSIKVALIDICWGAFISAVTSGVTYFVVSKFFTTIS